MSKNDIIKKKGKGESRGRHFLIFREKAKRIVLLSLFEIECWKLVYADFPLVLAQFLTASWIAPMVMPFLTLAFTHAPTGPPTFFANSICAFPCLGWLATNGVNFFPVALNFIISDIFFNTKQINKPNLYIVYWVHLGKTSILYKIYIYYNIQCDY